MDLNKTLSHKNPDYHKRSQRPEHKLDHDIFHTHQKEETLLMVEGQRDQEEDHLRCGGWTKFEEMKNETSLPEKQNINLTITILFVRVIIKYKHILFQVLHNFFLIFFTADNSLD